jgi:putative FmdB family regulatory protein
MPIYEYQCEKCGKRFEIFQKIGDEPLKRCRKCNGLLHKLISQCSFHLKGSGWYVTDYKKPVDTVKGEKKHEKKEPQKGPSQESTAITKEGKETTPVKEASGG